MSLPKPIPYQEAQTRLLELARPLPSERLCVSQASGRYLAADLLAKRTQPPADLSAMDGYAVRAEELHGPWTVTGESAAGHPYEGKVAPGEAIRISTGALIPEGAGAVLLQENAIRSNDRLELQGPDGATPRHIRRAGLDFRTGDTLIAGGAQITAAHIALAISGGHDALEVGTRPRIAIIDNGDELAVNPSEVAPLQIPASNGAMLAAMAAPVAGEVARIGPVPDRKQALLEALTQAEGADVIVTSGGASVGDHDLVRPALEEWGAKLDFWRIAMKPGKPLLVATRGDQIILGLPGNPVSSFVTAWLFLLPLLRRLSGAVQPLPHPVMLPCTEALPANGPRATFVRAQFSGAGVTTLAQQDSSALAAIASCDALIERPISARATEIGEPVPVFPLRIPTGA